ncbi:MAG TPA: pseudouridine-5'-phosphate glycosidase [Gemmataceae bacterium]|jgi:pseudouridine-5'-phosphate glycosidase|nr:pseudouridine-5'-phosphate glycosidase [Gemmataceae bacterium]
MLEIQPEIAEALQGSRPVVALESTLIAHGLPWPANLHTALAAEAAIRAENAIPATIAVWNGRPRIGLTAAEIEELAQRKDVHKASSRDLAAAIAEKRTAATTVAATMRLAHMAGIRVFATGGIGGVHRGAEQSFDISADLMELAQTPVAVICAGAKNLLDVPKTLELLETLCVPVIGYQTNEFPGFYVHTTGLPVSGRVNSPEYAAKLIKLHWKMEGKGFVLAQPVSPTIALSAKEWDTAFKEAERRTSGLHGPSVTPALLAELAETTGGRTVQINRELVIANARLAAQVAKCLAACG